MPCGQRDGSLRPYSRFSRPEPLPFLSSSSSIVLATLSGPLFNYFSENLVEPGIWPGPLNWSHELWPLGHYHYHYWPLGPGTCTGQLQQGNNADTSKFRVGFEPVIAMCEWEKPLYALYHEMRQRNRGKISVRVKWLQFPADALICNSLCRPRSISEATCI
jgi:hypothetical protein